jgi:hypothetical protein
MTSNQNIKKIKNNLQIENEMHEIIKNTEWCDSCCNFTSIDGGVFF